MLRATRRARLLLAALLAALALAGASGEAAAQPQVAGPLYELRLEGVISRYSVDYAREALREAEAARAEALILRLEAEGAVLRDVRALAADLAEATVPVVVYVAPAGARGGAAGAWLLSAATVAAIAPEASFGVAAPLIQPDGSLSEQTRDLLYREATAQLEDWNQRHSRNSDWPAGAVRNGLVLSSAQAAALQPPAVDLVARDGDDLLTLLEGRVVTLADGSSRTLQTLGRAVQPIPPGLISQLLLVLATPTVAFLLLVLAGIAIYAELVTPTIGVLAGLGLILLIGAMIGLLALPVQWLSVIGLVLAFGLVAADLFVPSHGALTVVGLVLVVASALTLFDRAQAPGVFVALWAVVLVALLIAAFAAVGIWMVVRTRGQPVATGQEGLIGRLAEVRRRLDPEGMVFVEGALWRAISEDGDVEQGDWVRVTGVYDLRLTVRRVADEPGPGRGRPTAD